MPIPKFGVSKKQKPMHYSVGAVIKRNGKYLLIDRATPPYGFAGVAGHVDAGERPEESIFREVREESGLKIEKKKLLFEEELDWNWCSKNVKVHYWYLYKASVSGRIKINHEETRKIGWYSKKEIKKLKLEPVWKYWFEKLEII